MHQNNDGFIAAAYHQKDKPTYYIHTFGCQMNVRDSQSAEGLLQSLGYHSNQEIETADIILFNTCCIRDLAEKKAEGALGSTKKLKEENPKKIIGIFGCMMQQEGMIKDIKHRFPFVDLLFGTNQLHHLPQMLSQLGDKNIAWQEDTMQQFDLPSYHGAFPTAYINIMQGCNNFCSYCIVPYVRGREHSRPVEQIINEVQSVINADYKEITLLGQNVNSYYDKENNYNFAKLLIALNKLDIPRIRFMTSHPKDLSDDVIEAIKTRKNVCKQVHLPIQSGSNHILSQMNRKYTREHYLKTVEKLRTAMPNIGISTDIIVGFPGESEEDFLQTLSLLKLVRFNSAYTFKFSKREGTPAAQMQDTIPESIKDKRLATLNALQKEISDEVLQSFIGKTVTVLVDRESKRTNQHVSGRCEEGIMVNIDGKKEDIGKLFQVKITSAGTYTLFGRKV